MGNKKKSTESKKFSQQYEGRAKKEVKLADRNYWLWVTRPEYYLNEDGTDRDILEEGYESDSGDWWTCHKNTQQGDLILLYRSRQKKDIGYLLQATCDAYPLGGNSYAQKKGWDYGCDFQVLKKFDTPLTLPEMRASPHLSDWSAFRAQFMRKAYLIPIAQWKRLMRALVMRNSNFRKLENKLQRDMGLNAILLEEELENRLAQNLAVLKPHGFDLVLCEKKKHGVAGRQLICVGHGGRIDLLCFDRKLGKYVVVELKNVKATPNTMGQIITYIAWVKKKIAKKIPVSGLVISRGADVRFMESLAVLGDKVRQLDLTSIGFT